MRQREAGNTIILALLIGWILLAFLSAQVTVTRVNINASLQRTISAQLAVQATLATPSALKSVLARLPQEALDTGPVGSALDASSWAQALQDRLDRDWNQCAAPGTLTVRVYVSRTNCVKAVLPAGVLGGASVRAIASTSTGGRTFEARVPLYITSTYRDSRLGQRTRVAQGELVFRFRRNATSGASLIYPAYQLLTDSLSKSIPAGQIYDGLIQVNGPLNVAQGRSEFMAGVSSATGSVVLGSASVPAASFGPSSSYPCNQLSSSCPKFHGGLSVVADRTPISAVGVAASADVLFAPGTTSVVLTPGAAGGQEVYACTSLACNRFWYSTDGKLYLHVLSTPVPPSNGEPFTPPEPAVGVQAWKLVNETPHYVLLAPGGLTVRALQPNGPAFTGTLTIVATNGLVVASNVQAQNPVCSSFAVVDANGAVHPAECQPASIDVLGLVALGGNVDLGSASSSRVSNDTHLVIHASVLAPVGTVALMDSRVTSLDMIGNITAHAFAPDVRMRLAQDPRMINPPGFPTLSDTMSAPTISLDPDGALSTE